MLKLYGFSPSTCTRLVALICKEKEIPYELITVSLAKGEQKSADFMKIQPFGQVPYIDDDGFIMYESRAIVRYLNKKYPHKGTHLIPTNIHAEALFEQAASCEMSNFNAYVAPIVNERIFKPRRGLSPNEDRVKELLGMLNPKMDVYDTILGKQKYLAGESITLADLFHVPYGQMLCDAGFPEVFESRPNLARWWNEVRNRPSWKAVKDGA